MLFLCPTVSLHRIFHECWIQIGGTTGALRAFTSGWSEIAVCLQTGYCRKFENGLALRLGEAWGGPTRESVLLQLLANSVSHLLVPVNGYLCRQRQQWCVS
jgi:hypothetical protein